MKKLILLLLFLITCSSAFSQCPGNVIGTAVAIPNGSFNCQQQQFFSSIGGVNEGPVTMCFNYYNIGPITLDYLLVSGLCGPFPLYNSLNFQIYDSSCTSLVTSGTIVPVASSTIIAFLNLNTWYTICYTWVPNCTQFSACPLIYTLDPLPINLLTFEGTYDYKKNVNRITWSTASEINSDYFELTKSYDIEYFFDPIKIKSVGNSSTLSQYFYDDTNFDRNKTIYYKLTEVDIDGIRKELAIISINLNFDNSLSIEIFDVLGRKQKNYVDGVNIIKRGEKYSKVIKIQNYGN
jgi:hypothetical protein